MKSNISRKGSNLILMAVIVTDAVAVMSIVRA